MDLRTATNYAPARGERVRSDALFYLMTFAAGLGLAALAFVHSGRWGAASTVGALLAALSLRSLAVSVVLGLRPIKKTSAR
jgi:hypothetical protein